MPSPSFQGVVGVGAATSHQAHATRTPCHSHWMVLDTLLVHHEDVEWDRQGTQHHRFCNTLDNIIPHDNIPYQVWFPVGAWVAAQRLSWAVHVGWCRMNSACQASIPTPHIPLHQVHMQSHWVLQGHPATIQRQSAASIDVVGWLQDCHQTVVALHTACSMVMWCSVWGGCPGTANHDDQTSSCTIVDPPSHTCLLISSTGDAVESPCTPGMNSTYSGTNTEGVFLTLPRPKQRLLLLDGGCSSSHASR